MSAMAYGVDVVRATRRLRSEALDYLRCISLAKVKRVIPRRAQAKRDKAGSMGQKKPNKRAKEKNKSWTTRRKRRQGPEVLGNP